MTIIKQFEPDVQETSWKNNQITLALGLSLSILVIIEIWVNHTLATFGDKFSNIENLQKALNLENQLIENDIAIYSSLSRVASSSASLGLTPPSNIQYIR